MVVFDEDQQKKRLDELRAEEEEGLVAMLARDRYGIESVDLKGLPIDNDAIRLLDEKDARALDVGPYKLVGKKLSLAVRSPVAAGAVKAKELLEAKGYEVTYVMASERSIQKIWSRYEDLSYATRTRAGGLDVSEDVLNDLSTRIKTIDDAVAEINGALSDSGTHHLSRLLEIILGTGIGLGASDVHIEPMEDTVELRFRLDGVLRVITTFDHQTYKQVNTRIKLLSGLKLTISSTHKTVDSAHSSAQMMTKLRSASVLPSSLVHMARVSYSVFSTPSPSVSDSKISVSQRRCLRYLCARSKSQTV